MDTLSILCVFFYLGRSWGQEQMYVVTAPKVFYVGASENVVIQVYGYTEPFAVTAAIKSYPDKSFVYSSGQVILSPENKFQNSANLTIQPKDLSEAAISHVYLEVVSVHFSKATKIPLRYDNGYLFIQTDRSVYNLDHSVKVRVYSLDEDLKPSQREVILTFIDPEGSEVAMVEKNNYTGIITFPDFKIPSNPKYGLWTIKAKYKEDFTTTGTAYFDVNSHDLYLKKSQLSILVEPENYFISHKNFEDFKITIKARYSYYKNVTEAEVSVFFGIRDDLYDNRKEMMDEATQRIQLINGVAQVNFNTSKAIKNLPYEGLEDLNNKYLNVFVEVEESTGKFFRETKETDVKYVLFPYTLNLVATPLFLKPGIPYSIKVQVKDVFAHFVGGITVILKAKVVKTQAKTDLEPRKSKTNSHDGVALFVVNIPTDATALEFHIRTDDPYLPEEYQASNDYQAVAYSSPRRSFLSLSWTNGYKSLLVGEQLSITVTPKSPYVDKITHYNFLISSKGRIVHYGMEKKLSGSSYQHLNLSVTQHMVPTAHLLVYYIITEEQTAELVSDSVCINIEEKCGHQLQIHLSPDKDIYSPGEAISLIMETQSESWVALTTINSVTHSIQRRSKNPMERVLQALDKSNQGSGAGGGRNSAEVFDLAGLTILTNANGSQPNASRYKHPVIKRCCYDGTRLSEESCEERAVKITIGPKCVKAFSECCNRWNSMTHHKARLLGSTEPLMMYSVSVLDVRRNVLENWLWEVYHIPKRYQLKLVLPDLPTTWEIQGVGITNKGLCIADTLQLQVYGDHFPTINDNAARLN
ncbi:complement C5-like isoform X2 [Lepus europaeus]|uniref:complement C5-like isoform X2 n=1 Tax=Lepus europaeus TaxID=9983 RepID=UPI002B47A680|nr:complement C5-like isoform X2 [Lepus europaeus]